MRFLRFSITASLLPTGLLAGILTGQGRLDLDGKTVALTHTYARRAPNALDETKSSVYVLAVDRELPPEIRTNADALRDMVWDKRLNGVELELQPDSVTWTLKTAMTPLSISNSKSPSPFQLTVSGGRVSGNVKLDKPMEIGDTKYYFEFPVDAAIESPKGEAPPSTTERADAKTSPAAKAYLDFVDAVRKGEKSEIRKALTADKVAMVDSSEFPSVLKSLQATLPDNITVTKVTMRGGEADLVTEGVASGKPQTGRVVLRESDGNWKVVREEWREKP